MDYKLLAVDMDGTLLNNQKEIPDNTLEAINEMIRKDYVFCISTGRPMYGVKGYTEKINGDIPLILYNGAVVTFSKSHKVLLSNCLNEEQSKKIIALIDSFDGTYIFWSNEELYVNKVNDHTNGYFKISNAKANVIDKNTVIPHGQITKIIWFDENKKLVEYQNTVLKDFSDVNFFTSQPTFLEFVSKGISKAKALEIIGDYYGINNDEMIAVGDGCNDILMLEYAGLGVAMANADEEVRLKADYVTDSNEEEGVLKVIKKFFK